MWIKQASRQHFIQAVGWIEKIKTRKRNVGKHKGKDVQSSKYSFLYPSLDVEWNIKQNNVYYTNNSEFLYRLFYQHAKQQCTAKTILKHKSNFLQSLQNNFQFKTAE